MNKFNSISIVFLLSLPTFAGDDYQCDLTGLAKWKRSVTKIFSIKRDTRLQKFSSAILQSDMSPYDIQEFCKTPAKEYLPEICYMDAMKAGQVSLPEYLQAKKVSFFYETCPYDAGEIETKSEKIGSAKMVYYSSLGYKIPESIFEQQIYWTSADLDKAPASWSEQYFYDGSSGKFHQVQYSNNSELAAVKCVPGQVKQVELSNKSSDSW